MLQRLASIARSKQLVYVWVPEVHHLLPGQSTTAHGTYIASRSARMLTVLMDLHGHGQPCRTCPALTLACTAEAHQFSPTKSITHNHRQQALDLPCVPTPAQQAHSSAVLTGYSPWCAARPSRTFSNTMYSSEPSVKPSCPSTTVSGISMMYLAPNAP
jgi:hypothetical protein